jgi:hypothetical protein
MLSIGWKRDRRTVLVRTATPAERMEGGARPQHPLL